MFRGKVTYGSKPHQTLPWRHCLAEAIFAVLGRSNESCSGVVMGAFQPIDGRRRAHSGSRMNACQYGTLSPGSIRIIAQRLFFLAIYLLCSHSFLFHSLVAVCQDGVSQFGLFERDLWWNSGFRGISGLDSSCEWIACASWE